MGVELTMLAYAAALLFVLVFIQVLVGVRSQGLIPLANSRDELPPPSVFQARVKRVVDNHREGLTIMAPLILIAAITQSTNATTALGAQLFFYSRVVHAGLYLVGAPLIRPLVWSVGVVGTVMVFAALMGWA